MRLATLALVLCALQSASGRPDFGLNADIKGSATTVQRTVLAGALFDLLDEYTFILGTEYPLLQNSSAALSGIAGELASRGTVLGNALTKLTEDDSGLVPFAFADTFSAIEDMLELLNSDFVEQFQVLNHRGKSYITNQLSESFLQLNATVSSLLGILRMLVTAAEEAQANAGGNGRPVELRLIRRSVSPRLLNALLNTVGQLPSDISPLLYSIDSSKANVDQADTYILTTKSDIEGYLLQAMQEVVRFNAELRQLKQDTVATVATVDASFQQQQPQFVEVLPVLQTATTYEDELEGALESFEATVSAGSIKQKTYLLEDEVASYISRAKTLDDNLKDLYGDLICPALVSVAEVLVASGPYASYCFRKFGPKVLDLAAHHHYDLGECYELELNRLYSLHRLTGNLVDLVSFNYANLLDNFAVCTGCPGSACNACVRTLGETLATLARLADEKFDLILQTVPTELTASLRRLESCAAFARYKLIADAHDLSVGVFECEDHGYRGK